MTAASLGAGADWLALGAGGHRGQGWPLYGACHDLIGLRILPIQWWQDEKGLLRGPNKVRDGV